MIHLRSNNAVVFDAKVSFYDDGQEDNVKVIGWRESGEVHLIVLELTDEGYIESCELPTTEQEYLVEQFERLSEKGL